MRFGVEHPAVNGVFFQPVTHTGRHPAFDPLDRLTNVEVIRGVCEQLPDWFREDDFVAVPCCSPTCRSATYALYDGEDLVPLPRLVDVDRYLGFVTNRAVPDLDVGAALTGLFSASAAGGTERTAARLECVACGVGLPPELQAIAARRFMVVAQDFQDAWTLDVGKLRKCCVAEIVPDGRLIPFCAYNSVGYREQVRGEWHEHRIPEFSSLDLEGDPKGCCARLYESDAARWLLDGELHPGGERLTLRLAELAAIAPGQQRDRCGLRHRRDRAPARARIRGGGSRRRPGHPDDRARPSARPPPLGLADRARFVHGDAEALPLRRATFDVALSECSLCTFPDKRHAVAEMARVLRPGGTIAVADVVARARHPARRPCAPRPRASHASPTPRPKTATRRCCAPPDTKPLAVERHDEALLAMIDRVEARLRVARMLAPPGEQRDRVQEAVALARLARHEVAEGSLGYVLLVARRDF